MSEDGYEFVTKDGLKLVKDKFLDEVDFFARENERLQSKVDQNRALLVDTFRLVRRGIWFVIFVQIVIALLL